MNSIAPQNITVDNNEFQYFSEGTYNWAYISQNTITKEGFTGKWVYKVPKNTYEISQCARAVRKFNLINPGFPAFEIDNGWMAPYLGDTPATDIQVAEKLVYIYQATRNIIADAYVNGTGNCNFLYYQGQVICIDVDHAFRRGSITTDQYLSGTSGVNDYINEMNQNSAHMPNTASVIKTLFYIDNCFSIEDLRYQRVTPRLVEQLHYFRRNGVPMRIDIMDTFLKINLFLSNTFWDNPYYDSPTQLSEKGKTELRQLITQPNSILNWLREKNQGTFIQWIFDANHLPLINELVQFPEWETLAEMKIKFGWSLFHLIAYSGFEEHYDLLKHLAKNPSDLNLALKLATHNGHEGICMRLLYDGANPREQQSYSLEAVWPKSPDSNPFSLFRQDLYFLVTDSGVLYETAKQQLIELVLRHYHLLNLELTDLNETICHLMISENNLEMINRLKDLPLSQIIEQPEILIDMITKKGIDGHYPFLLNLCDNNQFLLNRALLQSTLNGHAGFCIKLIHNGANIHIKNSSGEKLRDIWLRVHPYKTDIFNVYLREEELEAKKRQLSNIIRPQLVPNSFIRSPFSSAEQRSVLIRLLTEINSVSFGPEEPQNKTANDLLYEKITAWERGENQSSIQNSTRVLLSQLRMQISPAPLTQFAARGSTRQITGHLNPHFIQR